MTVQALLVLEGVECQQLLLFGSVCKFAYTLQGLDCNMRLDIQRLDPGMVVLHGMACISYDFFFSHFGAILNSPHNFSQLRLIFSMNTWYYFGICVAVSAAFAYLHYSYCEPIPAGNLLHEYN